MTASESTILPAFIGAAVTAGGFLLKWYISRQQRITGFRMAALEKRLESHQEAYSLWHELDLNLNDRDKGPKTAIKCQQWWMDHCLYLDPRSRDHFIRCAREAFLHSELKGSEDPADTNARCDRIYHVFKLLAEGVNLPSIGEHEGSKMEKKAP